MIDAGSEDETVMIVILSSLTLQHYPSMLNHQIFNARYSLPSLGGSGIESMEGRSLGFMVMVPGNNESQQ
jgi:hypothetical protein